MATVQSVINSARYDLQDYESGIMWDDTELLNYLNRMIGLMDSELAALNSDLVEGEELGIDTTSSQNYVDLSVLNSNLWSSLRSVWIAQDRLENISIDELRYKRHFRESSTGQPQYWSLSNRLLLFEQACDQAYTTLKIYYNKKTATLALTDSMPYSDIFNELFREMFLLHAQFKKDGRPNPANSTYTSIFRKRAMEETIMRKFTRKPYYIDF